RRRDELRQGPAGPGRAGEPRLPGRVDARRTNSQHGRRGGRMTATPQQLAERALELSRADDCIVLAGVGDSANIRWANNTLTTNGLTRTADLTVISVVRRGESVQVASLSRSGVDLDDLDDLVAAS